MKILLKTKKLLLNNPLAILLLTSLATRLLWLFFGMPSATNDEVDIYTSSYILGRTLKDFYGNWGFLTTGILTAKPSIPIYIGALPWLFTSVKSVVLARLPFVLLNSITPVLLYSLLTVLTGKRKLAFIAFLVLNFSPWFSYASATGYEAVVTLFFILAFFRVAVSKLKPAVKAVLTFSAAFCAFNSYMGMKPVFPFILFIGVLFFFGIHKAGFSKKSAVSAILLTTVLFTLFMGINYIAPNSALVKREYQIMLNYYEKPKIEGMVWFERWTSTGPDKVVTLLSNKYSIRLRDYASKYFLSFNPQLFFQKGDPSSLYGTADLSGLFFLTDFIFFLWGLYSLHSLKERGLRFLLCLFFIGGLPIALSTTSPTFILRGIILVIPYVLVIAFGMDKMTDKWKKLTPLLLALFIINYTLFFTVYKVRIANLNGEQWKYTIKRISETIGREAGNYKRITFHNIEPQETFLQYAFYMINDPASIRKHMADRDYSYGNLTVTNECPKITPAKNELVVFNKENCGFPPAGSKMLTIFEPLDRSGKDYFIFTGR